MSGATTLKNFKSAFKFILAVCFLDVLLNIRYPESDQPLWALLRLAPETLGVLLIVWLTVIFRIRYRAAVFMPLTGVVIFLRLFRIGDILVPMYFFRPFNLYLDSRFLPDLIHTVRIPDQPTGRLKGDTW